jgi:hypothetical protein
VKRGRILRATAAAGLILLGAGYAFHVVEHPRVNYASYADAIRDGLDRRGWLPSWVPSSARDLQEVHDLDTNRQWLRFTLLPADTATILARSEPLSVHAARQTGVAAPRMTQWPMELGRFLIATPRSSIRLRRIGPPAAGQAAHCFLLDTRSLVVCAWSC